MTTTIAVDIGGTFVDAIAFDHSSSSATIAKTSTTPTDPTSGVRKAIEKLGVDLTDTDTFVHGTTLGLNAVLERLGATTGIITNEGFADVFEMGRYERPGDKIYSLDYDEPEVLVPGRRRVGVPCRIAGDGSVLTALDEDAVRDAAEYLIGERDVESIAICYLHAYQDPSHEIRTREIIEAEYPAIPVSISSDLTRHYREFERTSTTVVNAYIKPIMQSYLDDLRSSLTAEGFTGAFFVTRSGGGALRASDAQVKPINTILSGPAGGLIGAVHVGATLGQDDLIAVDMGGTSTDACVLRNGAPSIQTEASLERLPLLVPIYDIRTIGAGGGSIASVDGQLLRVGPESAGADPGPICYGHGGQDPTVTDAALALGYLDPEGFLGGEMSLAVNEATSGIRETLAEPLGSTVVTVSKGVLDVAVGKTIGAIREITVETGLDPRELPMLTYGGAGPMLIPLIAREMEIKEVIVPQSPSVFSAWGMLTTDIVQDFARTEVGLLEEITMAELRTNFSPLQEDAEEALQDAGFVPEYWGLKCYIEMRYFGQEHTLEVQVDDIESTRQLRQRFEARHKQRYGHTMGDPIQIVHYRVRGIGKTDTPSISRWDIGDGDADPQGTRDAYCFSQDHFVEFDIYGRNWLPSTTQIVGPAIILEDTTTIVIHSDQQASIDAYGHVIIRPETES